MGLDIDCSCGYHHVWHGGYSTFRQYRRAVAKARGFDYEAMLADVNDEALRCWQGDRLLHTFLQHSDCDGQWTPDECRMLLPLLQALDPDTTPAIEPWAGMHDAFIAGMEHAIEEGHTLRFL